MKSKQLTAAPEDIMFAAKDAAQIAGTKSEAMQTSWYPCGNAGVHIKPARGKFITWCKANGVGRKDNYYGGWYIGAYEIARTSPKWMQSMNVAEDIAGAAARVLRSFNVNANMRSYID